MAVLVLNATIAFTCAVGLTACGGSSPTDADAPRDPIATVSQTAPSIASSPESSTPSSSEPWTPDYSTPRSAMDSLLRALRQKDVAAFLGAFSRERAFYLISSADTPFSRLRVTYDQLAVGVLPEGDYTDVIFGDDDNLRDYALEQGGGDRPWLLQASNKFVPSLEQGLPVYVRWTKRKGRYVIVEIAFPF